MRRAPFKIPPGLKARARFRKLFRGSPSSSVLTPGVLSFWIRIADDDEAFVFVRDVEKSVERVNRLLFVFGIVRASGVDGERGRTCDGGGVFCFYVEALAERRDRRCNCALGEIFVVDVCDVVGAEAAFAECRV